MVALDITKTGYSTVSADALPGRRRLLFLLPFAPRLDATNGGNRSLAEMLFELAPRHDLALLCLRGADEPPTDELLRARCALAEEIVRPPNQRSWRRRARHTAGLLRGTPMWASDWAVPAFARRLAELARAWRPDVVQIEFPVMGQYLPALASCPAPRVLVDHDAAPQAARDLLAELRGPARLLQRAEVLAWDRTMRRLAGQVDALVVVAERDEQALAPYAGRAPLRRIPVGARLIEHPLDPLGAEPPSLVFVGNFGHYPNADAALRLIQSIAPRVWARHPDATVYIVGDQAPDEIRRLAGERVVVTGRVPDVMPYLDRAALVVVPLRLGGGMRVKVLEALAAGKATVASPLAAEGLALTDGQQVALAERDEEFARAIGNLLADPGQRAALARRARAWACANLSWDGPIAAYEQLYQGLLERRF
jgi:glycosyltransferase involved in cell wall biosynthesis